MYWALCKLDLCSDYVKVIEVSSIYYPPQRSWGKVMFLQASVILLTGGEYLTPPPPDLEQTHHPPPHPPDQVHPPGTRYTPPGPGTPPPPWDQVHPPGPGTPPSPGDQVHPPGPGTPPPRTRYTPPPTQSMLGDTVNERAVRILLECNLVDFIFLYLIAAPVLYMDTPSSLSSLSCH